MSLDGTQVLHWGIRFSSLAEKKTEKFSCWGIISTETKQNNSFVSGTECFFFKSSLPLSCTAFEACQGTAEWEGSAAVACPAPPQCRWCTAEVTHAVNLTCGSGGNDSTWGTLPVVAGPQKHNGAESLCQTTAGSPDPLIFLSFCDMFRKPFAHDVYSL